jgi:hypothetical protein
MQLFQFLCWWTGKGVYSEPSLAEQQHVACSTMNIQVHTRKQCYFLTSFFFSLSPTQRAEELQKLYYNNIQANHQRSHQTDNHLELTVFLVDFYIFILLIFIGMLKAYQERINLVKFKLNNWNFFVFLFETKISNSFHHWPQSSTNKSCVCANTIGHAITHKDTEIPYRQREQRRITQSTWGYVTITLLLFPWAKWSSRRAQQTGQVATKWSYAKLM